MGQSQQVMTDGWRNPGPQLKTYQPVTRHQLPDTETNPTIKSAFYYCITTLTVFILHNQKRKIVPNCDVSFANGELRQAYGHVTLMMSAWPKYGHRSLVGCRLARLCSYSWLPCICRLIFSVVLSFDDFLCLAKYCQLWRLKPSTSKTVKCFPPA